MRFFDIKIACPQMFGKIRHTKLRGFQLENGNWVYSPFNGCEFSNGLHDCIHCQDKLRSFFLCHQEALEYGIVYDPLKM